MARQTLSPLAAKRRAAGFTQESLAEKLGHDRTTIGRWERGEVSPEPWNRQPLADALGITLDELDRLQAGSRFFGTSPGDLTPSVDELAKVTASQEETLAMTIRRARQFGMQTGHYIAAEAIEQLFESARDLAHAYQQKPLPVVLADLADLQDVVFALIERHHRPAESRQLHLIAGAVSGMLAKAAHDMGDDRGAFTHSRTAFLCAEQADHDGLRAWVKGLQALVAYWARMPRESLTHAQDGWKFAERSGSTTSVWLAVSEARAWAALGNARETKAAIERGEDAWENVQRDELDGLGGICTFGRSRQLYYAADALALLPAAEADGAERASLRAVEAYRDPTRSDWSFSDQAGSAADLAIARAGRNELEGAAEALKPVLSLPPAQRIKGIVVSLQRVQHALRDAPDSDQKDDLEQEIEDFSRTPLSSLTP